VTITVWRLFKKRLRATAFTGDGARLYGGRWNSIGVSVVYASESRSLALLETLVHLGQRTALEHYLVSEIRIDSRRVKRLPDEDLPADWGSDPPSHSTQTIGDAWVADGASVGLWVPSTLVPGECNLLLNPQHPDFSTVELLEPEPFGLDPRLRS
jgi:RES domain-containing protein